MGETVSMIVPGTSNEISSFSVNVLIVTSGGKSFHVRAPATGKARRRTVESLDSRNEQTAKSALT